MQGTITAGGTGTGTTGVTHDTESSGVATKRFAVNQVPKRGVRATLVSQLTCEDDRDVDLRDIQVILNSCVQVVAQ